MNTKPPAIDPTRVLWTTKDEAQLIELTDRKRRVREVALAQVREAVAGVADFLELAELEEVINYMAERAELIRDALKPFDGREHR